MSLPFVYEGSAAIAASPDKLTASSRFKNAEGLWQQPRRLSATNLTQRARTSIEI
jgi:hypothetical protein